MQLRDDVTYRKTTLAPTRRPKTYIGTPRRTRQTGGNVDAGTITGSHNDTTAKHHKRRGAKGTPRTDGRKAIPTKYRP